MGKEPGAVFHAMLLEPFLSWAAFSEVLLKMGPLLLIAQGLAIGFRAKVFNIGAEGQFILGAIFASAIPVWYPMATGSWIWPAMLLSGAIGGALWAAITAFWRVRLNANEILVSLMLSLVAAQVLNYLLLGPWKDPNGFNFPQSVMFQYDAMVPILIEGTRVNWSFPLTILLSLAAYVFMQKSFMGYKLQVGGPRTARGRLCRLQRRPRHLALPADRRLCGRPCGGRKSQARWGNCSARFPPATAMPPSSSPISAACIRSASSSPRCSWPCSISAATMPWFRPNCRSRRCASSRAAC